MNRSGTNSFATTRLPAPLHVAVHCGLALLTVGLLGCGQVNGGAQRQYAQLRVIDASTGAGGLDIRVNSSVLTYNIGFGSVVNYTPVLPGTVTLAVDQAGTTTALGTVRTALTAGGQYTLLIGNNAGTPQTEFLSDPSGPAPGGQSLLRIVDQAAQAGPVDLYFVPANGSLLTSKPVATVSFNTLRTGITVPANTYQIVLLPAGTVPAAATATTPATVALYTGPATAFAAGSARTLVLLDTQVTAAPAAQVTVVDDYDSPYAM